MHPQYPARKPNSSNLAAKVILAALVFGVPFGTKLILQSARAASSQPIAPTQPMVAPRHDHTATALSDGRVLLVGGVNTNGAVASAEIYHPATKSFLPAPDMAVARARHSATLLTNGLVLVAGGVNGSGVLNSAEMFDPAPGAFRLAGYLTSPRSSHSAIVLSDGRVLIAGGDNAGTAELFDPADETFHALPSLLTEIRWGLSSTLFSDNNVLLAGGATGETDSLELFNPLDLSFTRLPFPLATRHAGHAAVPTLDGKLLLIGGNTNGTIEEIDPATFQVRTVAVLNSAESTPVGLANGKTLVLLPEAAFLFTSGTDTFESLTNSASLQRAGATTTELPTDNNRILVAGGISSSHELFTKATLFNPARIQTDQDDYPPYSYVDITGEGFLPGEAVSNQVVQVEGPAPGTAYDSWGVVADTNGNFTTSWLVFTDELLNTTLELTAIGQASGLKALVTFWDGPISSISVNFPANGVTYNAAGYAAGINLGGGSTLPGNNVGGQVKWDNGTTDTGRGVTVSIKRNSDNLYWDGSAFTSASQIFNAAAPKSGTDFLGNGNKLWVYPFSLPADGSYTAQARASQLGETNLLSATDTFTFDTTPPAIPSQPDMTAATDSGCSSTDNTTTNTFLTFTGTAETGSTVRILTNGVQATSGTAAAYASPGITLSSLPAGTYTITATATDTAGNVSAAAGAMSVTILDSVAPNGIGTAASSSSSGSAGTNLILTLTSAVPVGDTVIVTVAMDPSTAAVTLRDNKGNTYTKDADATNGTLTTGVRTLVFSAPVTAALVSGDRITNNFATAVTAKAASAFSVNGLVSVSRVDKTSTATNATANTTPNSGSTALTTQANEFLVGAIGVEDRGVSFTPASSFLTLPQGTVDGGNDANSITIQPTYRVVNATGSYAASGTLGSGTARWAAAIVTYKIAVSGVVSVVPASSNPTCANTVDFAVTFSESVLSVDSSDFALATSGVSGASILGVSGSGSNYTVTVSTGTGSGTLGLNVVANACLFDSDAILLGGSGGNSLFIGESYNVDRSAPSIICPANQANDTAPGQCSAVVNYPAPTTTGGCAPVSVTCSPASGSTFQKGATTVTCTANDASGNTASCNFTVTVNDNESPSIGVCPSNITTSTDAGQCSAVVTYSTPSATDNCPGVTVSCAPASGTAFPKGTTTVTCTATDSSSHTASCSFTVQVNDNQNPTITCPANITQNTDAGLCTAVVTYAAPGSSDNCPGQTVAQTAGLPSGSAFPKGTTVNSFTVTDASGNTASCSFSVTVEDHEAPTITIVGASSVTVECHTSYTDAGASPSDNCDGALAAATSGSVDVNIVGDYTITYTASDSSSNTALPVTRTVHVVDTTKPVISLSGDAELTVECHSSYTDAGATASDSCAGDLTSAISISNPVNVNVPGIYTVTFNVTDPSGNAADQVTRTVHVTDTTQPIITILGDNPATVECHTTYSDAGATASDDCAGTLTTAITTVTTVNSNLPGDYTVIYTVSDGNGNSQSATRTVHVVDTTKPVITLNGAAVVTVECHTSHADAGATASDSCAGSLTPTAVSTVDMNTVGDYTVTFNVSDPSGNGADAVVRTVHVRDTIKPVISLNGLADLTVECHTSYSDAGATASDSCAGSLTPTAVSTVDMNTVGDYTVTFNVSDPSGNGADAVVRTVHVRDTIKPVISLNGLADLTVECHTSYSDAGATASDSCAGSLTPTAVSTVDMNTVGDYTVTFNVSDPSGNGADAVVRTVHVRDTIKPVISLNGLADLTVECHTSYSDAGATASDSCAGSLTPTAVSTVDMNTVGDYTVTFNVSDPSGNGADAVVRTVHVRDTIKPVISLNGLADLTVECHSSYSDAGATASDSCAGSLTPTAVSTVDMNTVGDYTVTFNVSDPSGNGADAVVRTVHVRDTIKPVISLNGLADLTVECHTSYSDAGATASDSCAGSLTPTAVSTVDMNTVGDYTVTFNVSDPSGNGADAVVRTVHVRDTIKPMISLNGLADLTVECHTSYADAGATASDSCAGSLTPTAVSTVDINTVGDYTVTFNVSDPSGNGADAVVRTVHVRDTIKPVISLNGLADLTVECHSSYSDAGATASDSCAGSLTPTAVSTVDMNTVGDYTVTFNVSDPSGNGADAVVRTVHVRDTIKPVISLNGLADLTVECHTSYSDAGATASDSCAGSLTPTAVSTVDMNTVGDYTVTFNVSDPSGNGADAVIRTVHVRDTIKAVISLNGPADLTVECHTSYADAGATASDSCAGSLTPTAVSTVDINTVGDYTVTFNVSDPSGNAADAVVRTVHVRDTIKPVISLNGLADLTVECHTSYSDAGATASDSCAGSLTPTAVSTVDINTVGDYTVTFNVSDPSGNAANPVTRTVHVVDTTKPMLTCPVDQMAPPTSPSGAAVTYPAPTATDSCDVNPAVVCTPASGSTFPLGTNAVTCTATDASGNQNSCSFNVIVRDTQAPTVSCPANPTVLGTCSSPAVVPAPTATDNCDPHPTVVCTPAVGSLLGPGMHTINVTATDFSGNTNTCSFTVTVLTSLRVAFQSPLEDDNIANNTSADGVDAVGTVEMVNQFNSGQTVPHKVKLLDCAGNDVTDAVASLVKLTLDVTERTGGYYSSTVLNNVPEIYTGVGDAGSRMVLVDHHFQYNLKTTGYDAGTIKSNAKFFQSVVRVEYLANPGVTVAQENVILESK